MRRKESIVFRLIYGALLLLFAGGAVWGYMQMRTWVPEESIACLYYAIPCGTIFLDLLLWFPIRRLRVARQLLISAATLLVLLLGGCMLLFSLTDLDSGLLGSLLPGLLQLYMSCLIPASILIWLLDALWMRARPRAAWY